MTESTMERYKKAEARFDAAWEALQEAIVEGGDPDLFELDIAASCHCLRHTFATNIYRSTQDLRLTQELLGHSSPAVTAIYAAADTSKGAPAVMALRLVG
jgi:site-specific recombinase XerD